MKHFGIWLLVFLLIVEFCSQISIAESQSQSLPVITFEVGPYAQWKPDERQIKEVETALRLAFDEATKHLGDVPFKPKAFSGYGRQYLGKMQGRRRTIQVIGFCNALNKSKAELLKEPMYVEDGGACFFEGQYDPEKKQFDNFGFNGNA